MVNYDLPWNPNRLEQRFGRIHRIGQTEVCHLWNIVANETREGEVFKRLFEKIEIEKAALGGKVFDVLGEAFDNVSLKDLLIEAIRYGEGPEVKAKMKEKIDGVLDTEKLNVNGGAIALGHPLGCSGAKLSVQLFSEMKRRKQKYGMVTACVGGGQGVAGIYELL